MKAVYPAIDRWAVTPNVFKTTLRCVRPAGRDGRESGVFWLGTRARTAQISAVVFPHGSGVEERAGYWQVSPEVFGTVTRWAATRSLCLLGVVHVHLPGVPIKPSPTDRDCGIRIPGILEVIIGNGGADSHYKHWGWHIFEDIDFRLKTTRELGRRLRIQQSAAFEACVVDAVRFQDLKEDSWILERSADPRGLEQN